MIEYLLLVVALLGTTGRDRGDLIAETLLLRRQLAVLTRPTRRRPQLGARDRLFWLLARLARRDWRQHLVLVTPETVVLRPNGLVGLRADQPQSWNRGVFSHASRPPRVTYVTRPRRAT